MDPAFYKPQRKPADQTAGCPLFDAPVDTPDIRTPPPVAPGSASSAQGAKQVDPHRRGQYRTIMLALVTLAPGECLSREALSERSGIKESSLCGRLAELRPLWVDVVPEACHSSSGVAVDGYRLTSHGRARLRERGSEGAPQT